MFKKLIKPSLLPKPPSIWYQWRVSRSSYDSGYITVSLVPITDIGKRYKGGDSIPVMSRPNGERYGPYTVPRSPELVARDVARQADEIVERYRNLHEKRLRNKLSRKTVRRYTGSF